MANIIDYLNWRGDLTFLKDPFNEVDNLILSHLTYTDFEGIENIDKELIDIDIVRQKYFKLHSRQDLEARKSFIASAGLLLDPMAESNRFKDIKLGYYTNIYDKENVVQFAAITYKVSDTYYIAFRGTDGSIIGWKEDFYFSYSEGTESQLEAVKYVERISDIIKSNFSLGGHSKGGNLAIYAATFCKNITKAKIDIIWANDSPGFTQEIINRDEYKNIMEKIYLILPESSVIGMLMENVVNPHIIKSDSKFIMQHYAMNWQVLANKFVGADHLSEEAIFIDKTIKSWLDDIALEDRKLAVESVFYCLEACQVSTFTELANGGIKSLIKIREAAKNLPKDQNELIMILYNSFIENSKNLLFEDIKQKFESKKSLNEALKIDKKSR